MESLKLFVGDWSPPKEGFVYNRAGGTKTETELLSWLGHRGQVGKLAPFGFPKNNKFLKD